MGGTPGTAANSPRGLTPLINAVALIFFLSNCEKRPQNKSWFRILLKQTQQVNKVRAYSRVVGGQAQLLAQGEREGLCTAGYVCAPYGRRSMSCVKQLAKSEI